MSQCNGSSNRQRTSKLMAGGSTQFGVTELRSIHQALTGIVDGFK